MAIVIQGLLNESREYYRTLKRELVGQLLITPRGYLRKNIVNGKVYVIMRQCRLGKCRDVYLGHEGSPHVVLFHNGIEKSKKAIFMLREVKAAMRELHMSKSDILNEDFFPIINQLFKIFDSKGLWEEGLELVGSWCFKLYQNYCGVEYYPDRSLDVDFALKIPYRGKPTDIGRLLKDLGFAEEFNYADGSVCYKSGEFKVEFLVNRTGDGRERRGTFAEERDLGISPIALPYMRILLDNPMILTSRDIGRVVVPTIPAFMLHKLIVAERRTKEDKREKDYRQSDAVARTIMANDALLSETRTIFKALHKAWQKSIEKSARNLAKTYSWQSGTVGLVLESIRDESQPRV